MALASTTLASANAVTDGSIVVALATGFSAGMYVRVDQELMRIAQNYSSGVTIPVLRGQDGTSTQPHPVSAKVVAELATDFGSLAPQSVNVLSTQPPRLYKSYSANGAITLPTPGQDAVAFLNGTAALTMSLANPTTDMDGCRLTVIGNGKAAHVVNYAAGLGNGGGTLDAGTAAAGNQCAFELMAAGGFWCYLGIPSATGAANAFLWA